MVEIKWTTNQRRFFSVEKNSRIINRIDNKNSLETFIRRLIRISYGLDDRKYLGLTPGDLGTLRIVLGMILGFNERYPEKFPISDVKIKASRESLEGDIAYYKFDMFYLDTKIYNNMSGGTWPVKLTNGVFEERLKKEFLSCLAGFSLRNKIFYEAKYIRQLIDKGVEIVIEE